MRSHCCSEFEYPCVRVSAGACCFSFVHCAGRVHGLSSSAKKRFTLLACVRWLQGGGVRYSPFQCFADSPEATQSLSWLQVAAFVCVLWCDLTPSLLSITIPCYLSHLPYLGWDITGFKRPVHIIICFLAPVISRVACLQDIFIAVAMATGYILIIIR